MKNLLLAAFCLCLTFYLAAQDTHNIHLQSLINAERAFAKMAVDKNVPEAFMANINAESINVEEGGIVKMKQVWSERKPDGALLSWQPLYADIASSGDFGFTTGPWDYRTSKATDPVAFGEFVTVWRKQPDNQWKIVIDIGVSHGKPGKISGLSISSLPLKVTDQPSGKDFKSELTTIENEFIKSLSNGINAYSISQSKEMRLYRLGFQPIIAIDDVQQQLQKDAENNINYNLLETQVASTGDLGFVTGTVSAQVKSADTTENKKGKYLRIWKKEDGRNWRIVLDLVAY